MLKSIKFWLIVSVCLNMLFIGAFIGGVSKSYRIREMRSPPNEIAAIMRALPPAERQQALMEMRDRPKGRKHGDIDALADLISAQPYERAEVEDYFTQHQEQNSKRIIEIQNFMLDRIDLMSDDERKQVAENLKTLPKEHKKEDRGHRPKKQWD